MREFTHGVGYVVVSLLIGAAVGLAVGGASVGLGAKEEGAIALGVISGLITFFVSLACIAENTKKMSKKATVSRLAGTPENINQSTSPRDVVAKVQTRTLFKGNYVTIRRLAVKPVQQDTIRF